MDRVKHQSHITLIITHESHINQTFLAPSFFLATKRGMQLFLCTAFFIVVVGFWVMMHSFSFTLFSSSSVCSSLVKLPLEGRLESFVIQPFVERFAERLEQPFAERFVEPFGGRFARQLGALIDILFGFLATMYAPKGPLVTGNDAVKNSSGCQAGWGWDLGCPYIVSH